MGLWWLCKPGGGGSTQKAAEGTEVLAAEPEYREGNRSRAAGRILKETKG